MKKILVLLLALMTYSCYSQTKLPGQHIQIIGGMSTHTTGDLKGLAFSTEYVRYFKKRLSLAFALSSTIHDGNFPIFFNDSIGNQYDGSIRYTTAGIQVASHLGYSLIRTGGHELQFRIGALLRYQSSSYYDNVEILYPPLTGLPMPVNYFINRNPQKTFALGGTTQFIYNYTFSNQISAGILGGFQMDSNGDNISQLALTVGKRF